MSDFKAKMHQMRLRLGLRSRSRWGSLLPQIPQLDLRGLLLREEKGLEGREGKGEGERGREGRGREGKGLPPF